jgi:hypothetical protein
MFAVVDGGANGMMTIVRGTIVQDVMWTEGYGAVRGLLSMPSNIAKGIAPISAAAIWTVGGDYAPVEWTVLLVSLLSAVALIPDSSSSARACPCDRSSSRQNCAVQALRGNWSHNSKTSHDRSTNRKSAC